MNAQSDALFPLETSVAQIAGPKSRLRNSRAIGTRKTVGTRTASLVTTLAAKNQNNVFMAAHVITTSFDDTVSAHIKLKP